MKDNEVEFMNSMMDRIEKMFTGAIKMALEEKGNEREFILAVFRAGQLSRHEDAVAPAAKPGKWD